MDIERPYSIFNFNTFRCKKCSINIVIKNNEICLLLFETNKYRCYSYPTENYISVHFAKYSFKINEYTIDFENESKLLEIIKCHQLLF